MIRQALLMLVTLLPFTLGPLVPEAAAKPTEINKCETITAPGSYVLKKSLTATGDCLIVAASFVTLDLDGQTLTGDGTGIGIRNETGLINGTVVRNGTVTNFAVGVSVDPGFYNRIEQIRALDNTVDGIQVGNSNTATGNTASGNGRSGIRGSGGLAFDVTITGNIANNNGLIGIETGGFGLGGIGFNNIVSGNMANNNGTTGILASPGSIVSGNTANRNGTTGIRISGSASTIVNNTAVKNSGLGIALDVLCTPDFLSTLIGNTAQGNNGGSPNPNTSNLAGCVTADNAF